MALPFLPGHSINSKLGNDKYHKAHAFDMQNGVAVFVGEEKAGIGGLPLPGQKMKKKSTQVPNGEGPPLPSWVAHDRQVLRFSAFFQEAVHEKREEKYRIRKCTVLYYLEDDSIQVNEAKQENSGIPQGTLIRRHRIPQPPPNDDEFYTVEFFNIGNAVTMYGRSFNITACDEFTRNYLTKTGIKMETPQHSEPADPYFDHRLMEASTMQPHRPYEKFDTLKQFLENDRKVLRFFCIWNNTSEMFGDVRELILHYFLADDTVEIREVIKANSGRDAAPKFLHRSKVPKDVGALHKPGEITQRTVLNVFGPMGHGGRYILDSLKTGAVAKQFYTDADLTIGSKINVWGREVTICDMDDFTTHFYRTKFGHEKPAPIVYKGQPGAKPDREIPPYNGWGSEEDSKANCLKLIAQAPKRDFTKFMMKDRQGLDSHVLRYFARLDTNRPIDMDRCFIISFFLSDDTISVFEPEKRNSGIVHGKFIERSKIAKPSNAGYYTAEDLFIGAQVFFRSHQFVITDADEYAMAYAEKHKFVEADIGRIVELVKAHVPEDALRTFTKHLTKVPYEDFTDFIGAYASSKMSQHSIKVLARHYADTVECNINYNMVLMLAKEKFRKQNFENFDALMKTLNHNDRSGKGLLSEGEVKRVCKAVGLPIHHDLLTALISKFPKTEGMVDHVKFIEDLKSAEKLVIADTFIPPSSLNKPEEDANGWVGLQDPSFKQNSIVDVNVIQFLKDLNIKPIVEETEKTEETP